MKSILYISDRPFPTHDKKISEVFIKLFQGNGFKMHYIFTSEKGSYEKPPNNFSIFHSKKNDSFLEKVLNLFIPTFWRKKKYHKFVKEILKKYNPDIVIIRNDISLSYNLISNNFGNKIVFEKTWANEKLTISYDDLYKIPIYLIPITCINVLLHRRYLDSIFKNNKLSIMMSSAMKTYYFKNFKYNFPTLVSPMGITKHSYKINHNIKPIDVIYIGEISKNRNPLFILIVLKNLIDSLPNIKFVIAGAKDEKQQNSLLKLAYELGIKDHNIEIHLWMSEENVHKMLLKSKIGISPIPPHEYYKLSSPTKVLEFLNFEIPVVCNKEIIDQDYVVNASGCGRSVGYEPLEFSNAIKELLNLDSAEQEIMGKNGRSFIESKRTYKLLSEQIIANII